MAHSVNPTGSLAAATRRLDRVQDGAVYLTIAQVHDRLVREVLDEGIANYQRLGSVQEIGEPLVLAIDVADQPATGGVSDERDEHMASTRQDCDRGTESRARLTMRE
jgi:hypothetical protein